MDVSKNTQMVKVEEILKAAGVYSNKDYIWSLQGPTLIYLGTKNHFSGLTIRDVKAIKDLGVKFLVEP